MTHEYTILLGGTVIRGDGLPDATAIAWAADTVLAIGTDEEVHAITRGDSHVVQLRGAVVIPLSADDEPLWPATATLQVGGEASMALLDRDPRASGSPTGGIRPTATLRRGRLLSGRLPGRQRAPGDPEG